MPVSGFHATAGNSTYYLGGWVGTHPEATGESMHAEDGRLRRRREAREESGGGLNRRGLLLLGCPPAPLSLRLLLQLGSGCCDEWKRRPSPTAATCIDGGEGGNSNECGCAATAAPPVVVALGGLCREEGTIRRICSSRGRRRWLLL